MHSADDREKLRAEEDALLLAAAGGDHAAFTEFYGRVAGPVYSLLVHMTGDAASAQDWLQQTMVKAWRYATTFDPARGRAFSWVVSIARRTALDGLRKSGREILGHKAMVLETASIADTASMDLPAAEDEARRVRHALGQLPEEQRTALERAFLRGMTHEEIARETGHPLGTVKARIRRGLLKLRELLNQEERS